GAGALSVRQTGRRIFCVLAALVNFDVSPQLSGGREERASVPGGIFQPVQSPEFWNAGTESGRTWLPRVFHGVRAPVDSARRAFFILMPSWDRHSCRRARFERASAAR